MRKFGIELEMVAPAGLIRTHGGPLQAGNHVLRECNIMARTNTHFGRNYSEWQCKPDGSIQPYERGVEVVSKIMPALPASYDEVHRAVAALETAGFGINRSCGFHVHISVADVPMHIRQLIVVRYAEMQSAISAFLPPSRRNNSFAQPLNSTHRRQFETNVDSGSAMVPAIGRYSVTNVAWLNSGDQARIEFRQAGGTCNPAKVIGWVRFLQEMIDEVVRRATAPGVRFGQIMAAPPVPRATPQNIVVRALSNVPRMRPGSDAHRSLEQLRTTGVITAAWAREQGIGENVLRRIIVGFRRHGADLHTARTNDGPNYVLHGARTLPMTAEQVFVVSAPVAPVVQPVVAPIAPQPAALRANAFISYPFDAGLGVETMAWIRDRRDTFNADQDQHAAA